MRVARLRQPAAPRRPPLVFLLSGSFCGDFRYDFAMRYTKIARLRFPKTLARFTVGAVTALTAGSACASTPPRHLAKPANEAQTFFTMTTGNGFGFQLFDAQTSRLTAFLDHPYRYLHARRIRVTTALKDAISSKNSRLGIATTGQEPSWAQNWPQKSVEYQEETNIVHTVNGGDLAQADRYTFSPFDLDQNAMITMIRPAKAEQGASRLRFHLGANP